MKLKVLFRLNYESSKYIAKLFSLSIYHYKPHQQFLSVEKLCLTTTCFTKQNVIRLSLGTLKTESIPQCINL